MTKIIHPKNLTDDQLFHSIGCNLLSDVPYSIYKKKRIIMSIIEEFPKDKNQRKRILDRVNKHEEYSKIINNLIFY